MQFILNTQLYQTFQLLFLFLDLSKQYCSYHLTYSEGDSVCVCVCVCECEREEEVYTYLLWEHLNDLSFYLADCLGLPEFLIKPKNVGKMKTKVNWKISALFSLSYVSKNLKKMANSQIICILLLQLSCLQ